MGIDQTAAVSSNFASAVFRRQNTCAAVRPDKSERAKVLRLDPSPFGPCLTTTTEAQVELRSAEMVGDHARLRPILGSAAEVRCEEPHPWCE